MDSCLVVHEVMTEAVSFLETMMESDGYIDRVYVSADHQRLGIGRRLQSAVIDEAHRLGLIHEPDETAPIVSWHKGLHGNRLRNITMRER